MWVYAQTWLWGSLQYQGGQPRAWAMRKEAAKWVKDLTPKFTKELLKLLCPVSRKQTSIQGNEDSWTREPGWIKGKVGRRGINGENWGSASRVTVIQVPWSHPSGCQLPAIVTSSASLFPFYCLLPHYTNNPHAHDEEKKENYKSINKQNHP